MKKINVTASTFLLDAMPMLRQWHRTGSADERDFRAFFGISAIACSRIWRKCMFPQGAKPAHLLWGLLFLKTYATESILCSIVRTTRKTFRKWSWAIIHAISNQHRRVIRWENRFNDDVGKTCKVTIDGTDFAINEPTPFSSVWYSHKFRGAGLRYEVGVCIQTGDIVWTNGPFPCGAWPDIKIFRSTLKGLIPPGEMVEADRGYRGEPNKIRTPADYVSMSDKRAKKKARARHETINRRLKQFGCLKQKFRHDLSKHRDIFEAVVVCTQLSIECGESPFQCSY